MGEIVVTRGVLEVISEVDQMVALNRHAQCDWGEVSKEDARANDNALLSGERILSVYRSRQGLAFWVMTAAGRSTTTLLMPYEY